jgi:two-component system, LytTR family, response regulator
LIFNFGFSIFNLRREFMNCIVVDDDKLSRTAIKILASQVDFLRLKQECATPIEAFNYLKTEDTDLIFLDVEMPGMSGIELIRNLEKRPLIILITSKKEYAAEAFELNVADYLLKPVSLSRFIMAVSKAKELFDSKEHVVDLNMKDKDFIFVRSNSILTKIRLSDIIYIHALGDYITIHTNDKDKRYTIHCTLKAIEEKLPATKFYRLHRSYLVALNHIDTVEDNTVYVGKNYIPIGELFKKELLKKLNLV